MSDEDTPDEETAGHDHDHDHGESTAEDPGDDGGDAGAEPEGETADADPDADAVEDGDVIRVSYTARTVEGGTVVDTTDPEVAEEAGAEDEGQFEPRVIVVGAGHLFEAVDADIVGRTVGESASVTVAPPEAFGEYDQDEVRTISADRIDEDDRRPGAEVTIDGDRGFVETIVGGRARVDFNHPLAGEAIEYEYEIVERLEDELEIARGLMSTFIDVDLEMEIEVEEVEEERPVEDEEAADDEAGAEEGEDEDGDAMEDIPGPEFETVTVERRSLIVEVSPQLSFNQQWLFQKRDIGQQLLQHTDLDRVVLQETIDGSGMGMGMPGMMGGMGGGAPAPGGGGGADVEEAIEEADVDAEEIMEEIEAADEG